MEEWKKYGSGWCLTFGLLSHLFFLLSFLWDIYPHSSLLLAVTHVPEVKDAAKVKTKATALQLVSVIRSEFLSF